MRVTLFVVFVGIKTGKINLSLAEQQLQRHQNKLSFRNDG